MARRLLSGVYKITNIKSNKIYVGSSTVNVNQRWNDHKSQMRTGIHPNIHLQRAYNKHGESNFIHEILELCPSKDCIEREQYWMDKLKPEYNICIAARNSYGTKRSEETCIKIGLSKIGNLYNLGKVWSQESRDKLTASLKEAYSSGRVKPHGLKSTFEQREKIRKALKGNNNRRNNPTHKNIEQYDSDGNFIALHLSARKAAEAVGRLGDKSFASILLSIRTGKVRFGFIWRLKDNVKLGELLEKPEAVNQQPS